MSVGVSFHRRTLILFRSFHPDLLRVWRQNVRAETKELWLELCEQAANEQDANKLLAMVRDINAALELEIGRLKQAGPQDVQGAFDLPRCILCGNPVLLGNSKTDENGKAVHDECYLLRMRLKRATSKDHDVHA